MDKSFKPFLQERRWTKEDIECFVKKNIRTKSGLFWTTLNTGWHGIDWDKAAFKTIFIMPANGDVRAGATTKTSVKNLVVFTNPDVLVDYAYAPFDDELPIFDAVHAPYLFGHDTHHPLQDFDMVLFSNSIIADIFRIPHLLHKSGIHLWFRDRIKDNKDPFLLTGGHMVESIEYFYGGVNERGVWTNIDDTPDENGWGPGGLFDAVLYGRAEGGLQDLIRLAKSFGSGELGLKSKKMDFIKEAFKVGLPKKGFYFPYAYKHHIEFNYTGQKRPRITKIEKIMPEAPDKVGYAYPTQEEYNAIPYGTNIMLDQRGNSLGSQVYEMSLGCGGSGVCSFCHSGNMLGSWKEKTIETMEKEFSMMRKSAASSLASFSSFNPVFHSKYPSFLLLLAETFKDAQHSSFRSDEMSKLDKLIGIYKLFGQKSFTTSLEGVSERMRRYLNKTLTEPEIIGCARHILMNAITRFKINLIYTGIENDDDWEEFKNMLLNLKRTAEELGKPNIRMEINISGLVNESNVPLMFAPRMVAYKVYHEEWRFYPVEIFEFLQSGIFNAKIDFNVDGYDSCMEQMVRDMGREAAQAVFDLWYDNRQTIRKVGRKQWAISKPILEKYYDLEWMYGFERPADWIFPMELLLTKPKSYYYKMWEQNKKFINEPYCLHTLSQHYGKCRGCGGCNSKEEIEWTLHRLIEEDVNVNDFYIALNNKADRYAIRIAVEQNDQRGSDVSASIVPYRSAAAFLSTLEDTEPTYNIVRNPRLMLSGREMIDFSYGNYVFDMVFRQPFDISRVTPEVLAEMSAKTQSIRFKKVYEIPLNDEIDSENAICLYSVDLSKYIGIAQDRLFKFMTSDKLQIITGLVMGTQRKEFLDKARTFFNYKAPLLYFTIPLKYNTLAFMNMLLGASYNKLYGDLSFRIHGTFSYSADMCSCGEYALHSHDNNQSIGLCAKCLIQMIK